MEKKNKIELTYKRDARPEKYLSALLSADEQDMRLLLYVLLLPEGEVLDKEDVCSALGIEASELDASVKYWCGAGLLSKPSKRAKAEKASDKKEEKQDEKTHGRMPSAHRGGLLERASELPSYTSSELSAIIEKRTVTAEFIDEAQRILGKVFNTHEIGILVGMVDYIGFDEHAVLLILSYMQKNGKKTLRYAERLAFELYDEGICTSDALEECFRRREENAKIENAVRVMFGMTGRSLTTSEKKYIDSWTKLMGFDIEVIRMAYDITVDNTHEPTPKYANKILENWYAKGIRTARDVRAAQEEYERKKSGVQQKESFVVDEFFEAALRRSFEELN